jgi:hypothetical protein
MMHKPADIVLDRARVREVVGALHSWTSLKAAGDALRLAGFDRADIDVIAPPDEVRRKLGSASTRLKVPIAEAFPLERAAKAHERFAGGHVLGKIVLRVHNP